MPGVRSIIFHLSTAWRDTERDAGRHRTQHRPGGYIAAATQCRVCGDDAVKYSPCSIM